MQMRAIKVSRSNNVKGSLESKSGVMKGVRIHKVRRSHESK
jgi:hypothetical protein